MASPRKNPILESRLRRVNPEDVDVPLVHREPETLSSLELRRLFRKESAEEFLGSIEPGFHRFGFSKGQFSLIDLVSAIMRRSGPAHFALSTWTVAHADLSDLKKLLNRERVLSARFLLDLTFQQRQPEIIAHIRQEFGSEAIIVTKNHAKFVLIGNRDWKISVRTSMNLNFNARLENIDVKDDPRIYDFTLGVFDAFFKWIDGKEQAKQRTETELKQGFLAVT